MGLVNVSKYMELNCVVFSVIIQFNSNVFIGSEYTYVNMGLYVYMAPPLTYKLTCVRLYFLPVSTAITLIYISKF